MSDRLKNLLQGLVSRLGFIYLIFVLVLVAAFNSNDAWRLAKAYALSRLMPEAAVLATYKGKYADLDPKILQDTKFYYESLDKYAPAGADKYGVYSMLGFCHYYLGEKEKAVAYYKRALEIAPNYFTLNYNLGTISFKEGRYRDAMRFLLQALEPSKEECFYFITSSSILFPFMQHHQGEELTRELSARLRDTYRNIFVLLNQCCLYEKKYEIMINNAQTAITMGLDADGVFTWQKGVAFYHLGNYAEAIKNAQELIAVNPNLLEPYRLLADNLAAVGSKDKAALARQKYMVLERSGQGEDFEIEEIGLHIF